MTTTAPAPDCEICRILRYFKHRHFKLAPWYCAGTDCEICRILRYFKHRHFKLAPWYQRRPVSALGTGVIRG